MRHTLAGIERDLDEVEQARATLDQAADVLRQIRLAALGLGQAPEYVESDQAPTRRLDAPRDAPRADDPDHHPSPSPAAEGPSPAPEPAEDPDEVEAEEPIRGPGDPEAEDLLDRINDGDPEAIRAQHEPEAPNGPAPSAGTYTSDADYAEWREDHPRQARNDDRVFALLAQGDGGALVRKMADALGVSEGTVSNSLNRLRDVGLVQRESNGKAFLYWTTEARDRVEAERYGKSNQHVKRVARSRLRDSIEDLLRGWPVSVLPPDEVEVASHLGAERTEVAYVLGTMMEEGVVSIDDGRYRLAEGATV